LSFSTERLMMIRDSNGLGIALQEQSSQFNSKIDLWMSEEAMLMHTQLMPDGINCSNSMAKTLSMNRVKLLMLLEAMIKKMVKSLELPTRLITR